MNKKRISLISLLILLVVALSLPARSRLYCRHEDINIKTGQCRITHVLCFFQISQCIKDTPLSLVLGGETIEINPIEAWHRVNTFYWGRRYSPHYNFHGAFAQARELELILDMHNVSDAQRKDATVGLLSVWQESGNYLGAREYLSELSKKLEQRDPANSSIATRVQGGRSLR